MIKHTINFYLSTEFYSMVSVQEPSRALKRKGYFPKDSFRPKKKERKNYPKPSEEPFLSWLPLLLRILFLWEHTLNTNSISKSILGIYFDSPISVKASFRKPCFPSILGAYVVDFPLAIPWVYRWSTLIFIRK